MQGLIPARAGNITINALSISKRFGSSPLLRRTQNDTARTLRPSGSSPLARGASGSQGRRKPRRRLIPARAGNIGYCRRYRCSCSAHPCLRGEHRQSVGCSWPPSGSSPLARGTSPVALDNCGHRRLIPARAGNISGTLLPSGRGSAHPRSRGEHGCGGGNGDAASGSSPLARGTCSAAGAWAAGWRLIPARAGNIEPRLPQLGGGPAHPRSRGEHGEWKITHSPKDGSSPLARGTSPKGSLDWCRCRLIPARAGNISLKLRPQTRNSAHPRSRGEHGFLESFRNTLGGSSPLARGTLTYPAAYAYPGWLIPARAGNMPVREQTANCVPAHPRSRGEHRGSVNEARHAAGSSPLARGT